MSSTERQRYFVLSCNVLYESVYRLQVLVHCIFRTGGFKDSVVRNKYGIPYTWLQQLAGLQLAPEPSLRRTSTSSSPPGAKSAGAARGASSVALSPALSASLRPNSSRSSAGRAASADPVLEAQDFTERVRRALASLLIVTYMAHTLYDKPIIQSPKWKVLTKLLKKFLLIIIIECNRNTCKE